MEYINNKGLHKESIFGIGDLVKIKDYGKMFVSHEKAFEYFWGANECSNAYKIFNKNTYLELNSSHIATNRLWKIKNLAFNGTYIIAYVYDRFNNKLVIGLKGLEMFKRMHKENNSPITLISFF